MGRLSRVVWKPRKMGDFLESIIKEYETYGKGGNMFSGLDFEQVLVNRELDNSGKMSERESNVI